MYMLRKYGYKMNMRTKKSIEAIVGRVLFCLVCSELGLCRSELRLHREFVSFRGGCLHEKGDDKLANQGATEFVPSNRDGRVDAGLSGENSVGLGHCARVPSDAEQLVECINLLKLRTTPAVSRD